LPDHGELQAFFRRFDARPKRTAALRAAALSGRLSYRHGRRLYVGLIWEGDKAGALEAITATNPLSGICGRVCDAPCEPACRRANADGPVAIRALKRWVLDDLGPAFQLPAVMPDKAKRVAIVGAGPAGLTAAQDIALAGYRVDLYEAQSRPGGMAFWGIPDFRLPSSVVEEDVIRILKRCPGIQLHLSSPLGEAVTLDALARDHDAVLLAIGASAGKKLGGAGDDLPQVVDGVTFSEFGQRRRAA